MGSYEKIVDMGCKKLALVIGLSVHFHKYQAIYSTCEGRWYLCGAAERTTGALVCACRWSHARTAVHRWMAEAGHSMAGSSHGIRPWRGWIMAQGRDQQQSGLKTCTPFIQECQTQLRGSGSGSICHTLLTVSASGRKTADCLSRTTVDMTFASAVVGRAWRMPILALLSALPCCQPCLVVILAPQ